MHKQCVPCSLPAYQHKLTTECPEVHPAPVKSPWHHLGIDFVGPISPHSQGGNQCTLTVSWLLHQECLGQSYANQRGSQHWGRLVLHLQSYSNFLLLWCFLPSVSHVPSYCTYVPSGFFVLQDTTGTFPLFCTNSDRKLGGTWGRGYLPCVMTTDQGREICNHANKELMNVFRIQHRLTTAYHPQPNRLDERLNQIIGNSLAKFAQKSRNMGCETTWGCVCIQHSCTRIYKAHTIWSNIQKNGSPTCQFQCLQQLWSWCKAKGVHGCWNWQ